MPPEILAKLENNQIKIFRDEEKDNYQTVKSGTLNSKGDYMQDFQTNFDDKTKNVHQDEILQLKQENSILNKILSNFFPDKKSVVKRDYSPTIPPIFKTTSKQPTILFPSNHRYNNKFIIPTESSAQNCSPYSCLEPKPSRFDYNFGHQQSSRVKDVPSSDHKSFEDFSSLDEIKQVLRDDPSFFTRLQGLENLRRTSPHSYSRSLKSKLGKVMAGRTNSEHLQQILSSRFRREAEEMILKRPAIFDKIKDKDGKRRSGLEAPAVNSPVQEYIPPPETSSPPVLYNIPSEGPTPSDFYNPPTEDEPPSEFYSVPGSDLPLANFTSQSPNPNNPRDPVPVVEVAPPPVDAPSSSVISADTVLQPPAAIASQDSQTSADIPIAVDLPLASVIATSLPSSSSSSSSSTSVLNGFDRNSALLTAFGLSLIPTLAISIPFLAPAFRRRGRVNGPSNYSYNKKRRRRRGEDKKRHHSSSWQ